MSTSTSTHSTSTCTTSTSMSTCTHSTSTSTSTTSTSMSTSSTDDKTDRYTLINFVLNAVLFLCKDWISSATKLHHTAMSCHTWSMSLHFKKMSAGIWLSDNLDHKGFIMSPLLLKMRLIQALAAGALNARSAGQYNLSSSCRWRCPKSTLLVA